MLCRQHGLFFTTVRDWVYDRDTDKYGYVTGWVLYREMGAGARAVRLGRRRSPSSLLSFVKAQIRKLQGETHAATPG